jgi:biopolymer transport protein ExbD
VIPEAAATQKLDQPRKDILHVFVERDGGVYINDDRVPMEQVSNVVGPLYAENQALIVVIRSDEDVQYQWVDLVMQELSESGAVRVTFYTNVKQRFSRERR